MEFVKDVGRTSVPITGGFEVKKDNGGGRTRQGRTQPQVVNFFFPLFSPLKTKHTTQLACLPKHGTCISEGISISICNFTKGQCGATAMIDMHMKVIQLCASSRACSFLSPFPAPNGHNSFKNR